MYCRNCGEKLNEGANFCFNCGLNLREEGNYYNSNDVEVKQRSKVVAGILGILVGGLGIHRFYLGYIGIGILQIIVTILTFGGGSLWGFIEGIFILCDVTITTDADGRPLLDK